LLNVAAHDVIRHRHRPWDAADRCDLSVLPSCMPSTWILKLAAGCDFSVVPTMTAALPPLRNVALYGGFREMSRARLLTYFVGADPSTLAHEFRKRHVCQRKHSRSTRAPATHTRPAVRSLGDLAKLALGDMRGAARPLRRL
jgi:hypothetical protein